MSIIPHPNNIMENNVCLFQEEKEAWASFEREFPMVEVENIESEIQHQLKLLDLSINFANQLSINRCFLGGLIGMPEYFLVDLVGLLKSHAYYLTSHPFARQDFAIKEYEIIENSLNVIYPKKSIVGHIIHEWIFNQNNLLHCPLDELGLLGKNATVKDLLDNIVVAGSTMTKCDRPPLSVMVEANKCLIAKKLIEKNLERLEQEEHIIYDIDVLM